MDRPVGGQEERTASVASCERALDTCRADYLRYVEDRGIMPSAKFPIPQGTLDMLILRIVSLEPRHGYGIAQRLQQLSRDTVQVNQGSLYPALHRLEEKAWLRAEWRESETGREAKFYSLTAAGRKQLEVEKESWNRLSRAVQLIFADG